LGKVDFSNVGTGSILALPSLFPFGFPTFHLVSILSMFIVVLVLLVEATAVFKAMGDILGTEVDAARVGRGLRSDMLFSALAPLIGALPCSTFAQNAGLVAMTGVKSRYVVATAGGLLVLIGLFPILGRIMAAIPLPVLGGAGVALFGAIAANGIQTLSRVDFSKPGNTVIVGVSLGIGLLPSVTPAFLTKLPLWLATIMHSGITSASITAVILNLVFNGVKTKTNATGEPSRGTVRQ
jgi:xanthine/uracil permease